MTGLFGWATTYDVEAGFMMQRKSARATLDVITDLGVAVSDIDDIVAQLKQKRDELRVQMHLASRDLQDEWHELEEKAEEFTAKARLGETGEGIADALTQLGDELKRGYERLRDAMKDDE